MIPAVLRDLAVPVIASPLFIVSGPELVIAQCKAGVIGSFPSLNARPASEFEVWLTRIRSELAEHTKQHPARPAAPFAVNLILHRSNERIEPDLEMCVRHEVPIVITSLQISQQVTRAIHGYGGIVLHDVISVRHAKKALDEGADGLIAVAAGAGGHAGTLSPFALVPEIRQFFDGPLVLGGAISSGAAILAAQVIGADLAYMGTRFIATRQANAVARYKQMLVNSAAADVVYSSHFSGVLGNYLKPSIRAAGLDPDNLPDANKSIMRFGSGGSSEHKVWRDIWSAGQGIGSIQDAPDVQELVARLAAEYRAAHLRTAGALSA